MWDNLSDVPVLSNDRLEVEGTSKKSGKFPGFPDEKRSRAQFISRKMRKCDFVKTQTSPNSTYVQPSLTNQRGLISLLLRQGNLILFLD